MEHNSHSDNCLNDRQSHLLSIGLFIIYFCIFGCTEAPTQPVSLDGLVMMEELDMMSQPSSPLDRSVQDQRVVDQRVVDQMVVDQMVVDQMVMMDAPDGELPMDGDRCDPRLRATACDAGFVCLPVPGGRIYQGRCVEGDGCAITGDSGCPEDQPYCHLRGLSTECTQASNRMVGEVCLDEFNRALPCAEGLVCNFSVCVESCDPTLNPEEQCGNNRRCVDLSDSLSSNDGFCGTIGSCNLYTNEGCGADEQCKFAVRPDDNQLVTFCTTAGQLNEGDECMVNGSGATGCSVGLFCIGSPEGSATCKRVCDTGAYEGPCPDGSSCREILSQGAGRYIRGLGLCVINP